MKISMAFQKLVVKVTLIGVLILSFPQLLLSQNILSSNVYVIPIKGEIGLGLASFIERMVVEAENKKISLLIFEVDTPGGRVDAAVRISTAILNTSIPTIAFINPQAISAGALIALSAQKIVMAPNATFGDVEPQPTTEKIVSYVRAQMRVAAEKNKRRTDIAEGMVDQAIEIEGIKEKGKLITLTTSEALKLQYADFQASSPADILEWYGIKNAQTKMISPNWAEKLAGFITNSVVSTILLMLGILGIIVELRAPGWGGGGTLALISFGLFFGGYLLVGLAGWEALILFLVGVILLVVEVFFIPGFGIAGVVGILALLSSVVLALVGLHPTWPDVNRAIYIIGGAILTSVLLGVITWGALPHTRFWNKMVLDTGEKRESGYHASPKNLGHYVGKFGRTVTPLRPAGIAEVEENRIDVVTEGEYIGFDILIRVVHTEGGRIVVRREEEISPLSSQKGKKKS